jgi:purine-binding chemotaxis protein CheW
MTQLNTQAQTPAQPGAAQDVAGAGAQYLTFVCGGEEYGVEILRVQEIKGWESVTRVPYAPVYVLGVMNLRGMIVPVIDLRTRLNLERRDFDASTVVIVVRVQSSRGEKTVGIVVDAVSEVYSVPADSIKPVPELGGITDGSCVRGIATVEGKMVMLLDINSLVAACVESDVPRALNG